MSMWWLAAGVVLAAGMIAFFVLRSRASPMTLEKVLDALNAEEAVFPLSKAGDEKRPYAQKMRFGSRRFNCFYGRRGKGSGITEFLEIALYPGDDVAEIEFLFSHNPEPGGDLSFARSRLRFVRCGTVLPIRKLTDQQISLTRKILVRIRSIAKSSAGHFPPIAS